MRAALVVARAGAMDIDSGVGAASGAGGSPAQLCRLNVGASEYENNTRLLQTVFMDVVDERLT